MSEEARDDESVVVVRIAYIDRNKITDGNYVFAFVEEVKKRSTRLSYVYCRHESEILSAARRYIKCV